MIVSRAERLSQWSRRALVAVVAVGAMAQAVSARAAGDEPVAPLSLVPSAAMSANTPTQGGGLKRQLDKVLAAMDGRPCFMLRASDFPPNRKNQTAQAFRKFRDGGGRQVMVPIPEWERMIMVREFHTHHRNDPGFASWFAGTKLLSKLAPMIPLMRLDLMGYGLPKAPANGANGHAQEPANGTRALAAYQPACAGCHAGDFKPGAHKKYENPDTPYTVSELRDCTGACHVYTDSSLTTIKDSRPGPEHRVNAIEF